MGKKKRSGNKSGKIAGKTLALIKSVGKWFFGILGGMSFLMILLSFTDIPFNAYYRLGTINSKLTGSPDMIVLLSGSGMPSPDGLIRAYYGVEASRRYPKARIIIALPYGEGDSWTPLKLMAEELIVKGVDSSRILFEPHGFNTRSQALNIATLYPGDISTTSILLVTTPEHMYRSVRAFQKVGFTKVAGKSTFDVPVDPEKAADLGKAKDIRVKSLNLRYNMWSYLQYELLVMKEYTAIVYYRLKGWI